MEPSLAGSVQVATSEEMSARLTGEFYFVVSNRTSSRTLYMLYVLLVFSLVSAHLAVL